MAAAVPTVVLERGALEAIQRGHPWVWRGGVQRDPAGVAAGSEVEVVDGPGACVGHGIFDPDSPIAVRMWTRGHAAIDGPLFSQRIERALALRARLFDPSMTTAYRLLHGEGDRVPGLVVDRYAKVAVVRTDGAGAEAVLPRFVEALEEPLRRLGIETLVVRRSGRRGGRETDPAVETLFGPAPPGTILVHEHGVPFVVDLAKGQKTGAFLDQRENRRRVGGFARGRTVLNLFSYAGGFSLHAVLGGATRVTSVDVAMAAHATAQESFAAAKLDTRAHEFVTADVFAFLTEAKRQGRSWDLVVSDPPSFAPSEKTLPRALSAYRALHRACVGVLAPDGMFCAASCSSHVGADLFVTTLDDGALGRSDLRLLELHGAPPDHPTVAGWPEGRYLKFAVLA